MKKLFILSLFFLCTALSAQQYLLSGSLTIFSDTSEPFFVYLNGELQNNQAQSNITITNLNQRYYTVKIIFKNISLKGITKNYVSVMDRSGNSFENAVYKIKIDYKTKKTKLNYYSGQKTDSDFYPNQEVLVIDHNSSSNQNVTINNGINITINNNKKSQHDNPKFKDRKCPEITNANFEIAKTAIKKENFDDQKLILAQNIISNNCIKTDQIMQIAKLFSFADNQLRFVKQAYGSCTDIKNYYLIKDVFSFQTDQQEFMNFMNFINSQN